MAQHPGQRDGDSIGIRASGYAKLASVNQSGKWCFLSKAILPLP